MKRAKSISVASNGHRVDMPYHVFNYQGDTFVAHVGLGHPLKISHVGIAIAGRAVTKCRIRGESRIVLGRVFNPVYPSPCDLTPEDSAELERQMNEIVIPWMLDELKAGRTPKYFPFSGVLEEKLEAEPISPFRCGACRGTMTVGADGTLYPCHRFVGMKKWIIGTIWDGPDVERCKSFWREYHAMSRKHCFSCWAYQFCKGPCPWEVAHADGSFIINERNCDEAKHWIMQGAWFESLYAKTMKGMKT